MLSEMKIAYVYCNLATLDHDLNLIQASRYIIEEIKLFICFGSFIRFAVLSQGNIQDHHY
ncbi:hypothetical protein [Thermosyntropha lipolytica]|uniref:hypothetical protein n=1 Tax=Thermosyntropha lipolytica TaxID=54294 RepID=UPI000932718D|nr:hypothetical protein [Thermosyntropha lipolytica]